MLAFSTALPQIPVLELEGGDTLNPEQETILWLSEMKSLTQGSVIHLHPGQLRIVSL